MAVRLTQYVTEVIVAPTTATVRLTQYTIEAVVSPTPNLRLTQQVVEVLRSTTYNPSIDESVSSTITFTQSLHLTSNQSISSTITLSQTLSRQFIDLESISSSLVFSQSLSVSLLDQEAISSAIIFSQSITTTPVHTQAIYSTITFTETLRLDNPVYGEASSTLTFSHVLSVRTILNLSRISPISFTESVSTQGRPTSSSLILTQHVSVNVFYNLHSSDTLIFNDPYYYERSQFRMAIPVAFGTIKQKKCLVILTAPAMNVVLPCPYFGDSLASSDSMNLKKSMNNQIYTYVKSSFLHKLSYTFGIGRAKLYELRTFLINYLSYPIILTNWKDEVWYGYITNNPVEFTPKTRSLLCDIESIDVNIQFEGIRIR